MSVRVSPFEALLLPRDGVPVTPSAGQPRLAHTTATVEVSVLARHCLVELRTVVQVFQGVRGLFLKWVERSRIPESDPNHARLEGASRP